jgi:hypothetical protein
MVPANQNLYKLEKQSGSESFQPTNPTQTRPYGAQKITIDAGEVMRVDGRGSRQRHGKPGPGAAPRTRTVPRDVLPSL